MVEEVKKFFHQLLKTVDGLQAIVITDREGVPVLKISDETASELALRPKFLSASGMAMEQAGKLGLGSNNYSISFFKNYQVVCFNKLPVIVTMIATAAANTGMILGLESDIENTLHEITSAVDVS
ncbi:hypothetical protein CAPTEDRAFT_163273 [Capitella teleta]|uniref:Roadblock/LAMTOR2 domain-containing protein n=1 Tax=Capitella teleta TaxID=283909 RepID=R7UQ66_CAPTE|nr:hypothetical protein CAPTEDRAFT_163273 [Capitella teleta]|eukprot:ELU08350.1 hypothetical protein CAPTEDRAFT_163273 [Capitella teleta]